jgi:hypothetical protein
MFLIFFCILPVYYITLPFPSPIYAQRKKRKRKSALKKIKTTAPRLRAWSPTALLSGPERAWLRRSNGMRYSHDCMAVGENYPSYILLNPIRLLYYRHQKKNQKMTKNQSKQCMIWYMWETLLHQQHNDDVNHDDLIQRFREIQNC